MDSSVDDKNIKQKFFPDQNRVERFYGNCLLIGQLFCVSNSAFANKGFLDVSLAISVAETGCRVNC